MKSFAVIGLGRFGRAVARQLFEMGNEVLVVDKTMDNINEIADYVTRSVCADSKDEGVLKSIGITNYECVIVAIGDNITDSVLTTLTLKELGIKHVICKARGVQHEKILKKIGADMVIVPEQEAGVKLAISLVSNHLLDIIRFSDDYSIADSAVPQSWVGKSIIDVGVRKKYGFNIIAVKNKKDEKNINITPGPDYIFTEDDIVLLVGKTTDINFFNGK